MALRRMNVRTSFGMASSLGGGFAVDVLSHLTVLMSAMVILLAILVSSSLDGRVISLTSTMATLVTE